ncbi:hypothetical protein MPL1032_240350 [Mesorhizobium plurifarium]|uniref:BFD-like [2Fe-2S]-binding domain-containing protein n=1 Tax=Mesorhizobium plurifarium TaxID=69974 RepID=A0A0K2W108_MESPL|nr:hypothetical protein MPL1032_240350 [Mesorhizobium plurifarium]
MFPPSASNARGGAIASQPALRAGTNCGSCRSEIKAIIDARPMQAAE